MKEVYYRTLAFFGNIKSKIAFYPTVLALVGIFTAFLMIYLEGLGVSKYFFRKFPAVMVENGDTALTVLSALITGLISMMVFSFSMVMLLLSQASNNYSPRLLPGLISDKVLQKMNIPSLDFQSYWEFYLRCYAFMHLSILYITSRKAFKSARSLTEYIFQQKMNFNI